MGPFIPPEYSQAEQKDVKFEGVLYTVVTGRINAGARAGDRQIIWINGAYPFRYTAEARAGLAKLTNARD
jgi:hypothetical protein